MTVRVERLLCFNVSYLSLKLIQAKQENFSLQQMFLGPSLATMVKITNHHESPSQNQFDFEITVLAQQDKISLATVTKYFFLTKRRPLAASSNGDATNEIKKVVFLKSRVKSFCPVGQCFVKCRLAKLKKS